MIIYIDETKVSQEKENIKQAEKYLNEFYKHVNKFLGNLSADEVERLPTSAKTVIMDNLRKRYEFPNASDKFNLDALGIDASEILSLHKQFSRYWSKYKFKYDENGYIIDEEQKYLKQHYSYADTETKKSLITKYEKLQELYNELAELGVSVNRTNFYKTFPNVFKDVKNSAYVRLDGERLAMHLKHLNGLTPLRPQQKTAIEVFESLGIISIKEKYKE